MLSILVGFALCQNPPDLQDAAKEAKVSMLEAIEKGLAEAVEGIVYHAELEFHKGKPVYSIDISQGDTGQNILISAEDGSVVTKSAENAKVAEVLAASKVDLREIVKAAAKERPDGLIDAHLRMQNGQPVVQIKGVKDGLVDDLAFDAATGKPIDPNLVKRARFTADFGVDKEELQAEGRNPFFILEPGYQLVLESQAKDAKIRKTITVLRETREIDGVQTRGVETKLEGSEVLEVSRGFYAISKRTNDVFCFGREVEIYKDGEIASREGSWIAGENKAAFGLAMPGSPLMGARFQISNAPKVAMDRGLVESLSERVKTPKDAFKGCLRVAVTSSLKQGSVTQVYARGVGLVYDAGFLLVEAK